MSLSLKRKRACLPFVAVCILTLLITAWFFTGTHNVILFTDKSLDYPLPISLFKSNARQIKGTGDKAFAAAQGRKKPTDRAIVSNVQNEKYVPYALCLAYTIQKYKPANDTPAVDLVLLVPTKNDITTESSLRLQQAGWTIRIEDDVIVEGTEKLNPNFRRNFIKLRVWSWTEYRKILFLDADTMVMGDISLLISDGFGTSSSIPLSQISGLYQMLGPRQCLRIISTPASCHLPRRRTRSLN
jgi:alpha-N-acetylglucosamine transferase